MAVKKGLVPKFVSIAAAEGYLFGLDTSGRVWSLGVRLAVASSEVAGFDAAEPLAHWRPVTARGVVPDAEEGELG
jgi:hypothetical protein